MKKTIYLSGSISDHQTSEPREGWQEAFLEAEEMLKRMGFGVLSPVDIAKQTEEKWREAWTLSGSNARWNGPIANAMAAKGPTRATYITSCLEAMNTEAMAGRLHGMLVIGGKQRLYQSHGVQMELHMAELLGLPVFYLYYQMCQVDLHLLRIMGGLRLTDGGEFGNEDWSGQL